MHTALFFCVSCGASVCVPGCVASRLAWRAARRLAIPAFAVQFLVLCSLLLVWRSGAAAGKGSATAKAFALAG